MLCTLCRNGHGARNRLFDDGQVYQARKNAERDREPPHGIVRTEAIEHDAAEPSAKEATDLVAEEGEARQRA